MFSRFMRLSIFVCIQTLVALSACFDFTDVQFGGAGARCGDLDHACREGFRCAADAVCVGDCEDCGKLLPGDACDTPADCKLDVCANGVCCRTECDGICMSCVSSRTGADAGTCAPVLADSPGIAACNGYGCDGNGACVTDRGSECGADSDCKSGHCSRGTCCETECAGLCESCDARLTGVSNGLCLPTIFGRERADECFGPATCDGSKACLAVSLGGACTAKTECVSLNCVDGVCCAEACDSACAECGSDGVCAVVAGKNDTGTCDAFSGCPSPPCTCDQLGVCKGALGAACGTDADCAGGLCVDGVCCDARCDGRCMSCSSRETGDVSGACRSVVPGTDPQNECSAVRFTDRVCAEGGACSKFANGGRCDDNSHCESGFCSPRFDGVSGGYCCNEPCDRACHKCDGGTCYRSTDLFEFDPHGICPPNINCSLCNP